VCMCAGINIQKGLHGKTCVLLSTPESQIQLSTFADLPENKAKIGRKSNVKHQYLTFGHTLFGSRCTARGTQAGGGRIRMSAVLPPPLGGGNYC
jgi:hypothetical protein